MESRINGHTRLFALIGSPVGHSGSPAMHNYSFARRGIDAAYLAFDVPEERTADAIEALRTLHAGGFNVTMPCKTEAARLVDRLSPAAELIGACNTVVMEEDGTLTGHNTDGIGFVRNLKEHGVEVKGQRIVILGTGGAATAIAVQAALDGAAQIAIFNRKGGSYSNGEKTVEKIRRAVPDISGVYIEDINNREALKEAIAGSDLLVNATSLGMCPMEKETPVPAEYLHPGLAVADVDAPAPGGKRSRLPGCGRRDRHATLAGGGSVPAVYRAGDAGGRSAGAVFHRVKIRGISGARIR